MKRSMPLAFSALDRGGDLVRNNWGAVGLLWLCTLPTRLLLLDLILDAFHHGAAAQSYGDALVERARWVALTWLLSLYGRQAFVRSCRASMGGTPLRGWRRFGAPAPDLLAHAQSAIVVEALFWALAPLMIFAPPLCIVAGLCAVASPLEGPGWARPFRALAVVGSIAPILVVGLGMMTALMLLAINLHYFAQGMLWMAGGVTGWDLATWAVMLDPMRSGLYAALLLTGASLLVEPFWIASLVVLVQESRARASGEDLRDRLSRLPASDLPMDDAPTAAPALAQARA